MKANIIEIERFAVHDGPGIRTVVFLKGCPLRCPWCANPESQSKLPQLMYNRRKCVHCLACVAACRYDAIRGEAAAEESVVVGPVFIRENCVGCMACQKACPTGAITFSGRMMAVDDIIDVVLRDRDYYDNSGGGVTFSGGEPFYQPEALLALLQAAKAHGLTTAVETEGHARPDDLQKAAPFVDVFLFDLKHPDPETLRRVAGGDANLIGRNLAYLASLDPGKITIRIPVIPGFNHDRDSMEKLFTTAAGLGIRRVDLLPYHNMARNKYAALGLTYPMGDAKMLAKEALVPWKALGESMSLLVRL